MYPRALALTLRGFEWHEDTETSRARVLQVPRLGVLWSDEVLRLSLGVASRQPGRRGLPHRPRHVVRTATDNVSDVFWTDVNRKYSDDAALGRRTRGGGAVDERAGGTETNVQLTQLFRMLHIHIFSLFFIFSLIWKCVEWDVEPYYYWKRYGFIILSESVIANRYSPITW